MTHIVFIPIDGDPIEADVAPHATLMTAAFDAQIPGILGNCSGNLTCATCHVYIDEDQLWRLPDAATAERELIECLEYGRPNSRLGCQVTVTEDMDGLVVRVAPLE